MRILAMFLLGVLVAFGQYAININKKVELVNNQTTNLKKEEKEKEKEKFKKFEDLGKQIIQTHIESVKEITSSNENDLKSMLVVIKDYTVAYRELNSLLINSKDNKTFIDSENYKNLVKKLYKTSITLTNGENKEVLDYEGLPVGFDCNKYNMDFCFTDVYNQKITLSEKYDLVIREVQLPQKPLNYYINSINFGYDFKKLIP